MNNSFVFLMLIILVTMTALLSGNETFLAGDQSILIFPTAYTMPGQSVAFTNYMVFIMQFTFATTNSTHITTASLFPITVDAIRTFTPGIKQRYFKSDNLQLAIVASYTPAEGIMNLGNIISIGKPQQSIHAGSSIVYAEEYICSFFLGGRKDLSKRISLLGEIASTNEIIEEASDGLMTVGIRFKGETTSWDIGGFRPIREAEGIFLFPFLKATVLF